MCVHFNIIWEEHELRGSGRWLLCCVGVGTSACVFRSQLIGVQVFNIYRSDVDCMYVHVCVSKTDCTRVSVVLPVWQQNRSRDLKNTCSGPGEASALSWQHCLGLGGYFKGPLGIKASPAYSRYTFSILRSRHLTPSARTDCSLYCFAHSTTGLIYCRSLAPLAGSPGQVVHNVVAKLKINFRFCLNLFRIYYILFLIFLE